ncbi:hypothetical protein [Colwellia sp. 12G3]|nr:hypothetical protein [Colwellia sp. 12G3]
MKNSQILIYPATLIAGMCELPTQVTGDGLSTNVAAMNNYLGT